MFFPAAEICARHFFVGRKSVTPQNLLLLGGICASSLPVSSSSALLFSLPPQSKKLLLWDAAAAKTHSQSQHPETMGPSHLYLRTALVSGHAVKPPAARLVFGGGGSETMANPDAEKKPKNQKRTNRALAPLLDEELTTRCA